MAKIFITIGLMFVIYGILLYFFEEFPLFKLPGDIYIEKENFKFYFPITSSILISIIFTIILNIVSKFIK